VTIPEDLALAIERDDRIRALGPRPPWWRPLSRRAWRRKRAAILATDVSIFTAMLRSVYTPESTEEMARRPAGFGMFRKRAP
jgi:myo-inositol catabolism protein IolC